MNFQQKVRKLEKSINVCPNLFQNFSQNKSFQQIIKKYQHILFITDKNIYPKSRKILKFLPKNSIIEILNKPEADIKIIKKIIKRNFDFILAFGSGTINDIAKYSSFLKKTQYCIIASAPSMNGYNSTNASIAISGQKKSLKAHLPIMAFFDINFLEKSPKRLIKSGIGDSICLNTCNFDWLLANFFTNKQYNIKIYNILKEKFDMLCNSSYEDPKFMKILCQNLIYSGFAMTIFGSSDPASQSEHLMSHYLEMKYPKIAKNKFHGEHIAICCLIITKIQEKILKKNKINFKNPNLKLTQINKIFSDKNIAESCYRQLQNKKIDNNGMKQKLKQHWPTLKNKLSKNFITTDKITKIYNKFDLETTDVENKKLYNEAKNNAFIIRDRFTCLDLSVININFNMLSIITKFFNNK